MTALYAKPNGWDLDQVMKMPKKWLKIWKFKFRNRNWIEREKTKSHKNVVKNLNFQKQKDRSQAYNFLSSPAKHQNPKQKTAT